MGEFHDDGFHQTHPDWSTDYANNERKPLKVHIHIQSARSVIGVHQTNFKVFTSQKSPAFDPPDHQQSPLQITRFFRIYEQTFDCGQNDFIIHFWNTTAGHMRVTLYDYTHDELGDVLLQQYPVFHATMEIRNNTDYSTPDRPHRDPYLRPQWFEQYHDKDLVY